MNFDTEFPNSPRLWLLFFREYIGNTTEWPNTVRPLILSSRHLTNVQRYTVISFMLINGVRPSRIKAWLNQRFRFDSEAWRQINYLMKVWADGTKTFKQWNVAEGSTIEMRGHKEYIYQFLSL